MLPKPKLVALEEEVPISEVIAPTPEPEPKPEPEEVVNSTESKEDGETEPAPLNTDKFFSGYWHGKPNYKCPYCAHATLEGTDAIYAHIQERVNNGGTNHLQD